MELRPGDEYVLGHSRQELDRLTVQARLLAPITRRFLIEAGLRPGMRVLDAGSGMGDVTALASELVGPEGEVIGVDLSPTAIAAASHKFSSASARNVRFVVGDAAQMTFGHPFDAIVGRYVLMYQRHPSSTLRGLAAKLRPGGLIVFHELDWGGARSFPPAPLYDRCCRLIVSGLQQGNAEAFMGTKLCSAFEQAGLPSPVMRLEAVIGQAGAPTSSVNELLATIFPPALSSTIENDDLLAGAAMDAEGLGDRLVRELETLGSVIVGRSEVGAWTRC